VLIEQQKCPDILRPLLAAALHRRHYLRIRDAVLPADAFRVTYDGLCADWDYEMTRLLEYCGLPVPEAEELRELAQPVERVWPDGPFKRYDIARVVNVIAELDDTEVVKR